MEYIEKTIKSDYIYKGKIINLRKDVVMLPNNKEANREIVEHNGGACALAVKDNYILFVKQFRYAYKEHLIELPAGKIEKNEDPLETIRRELKEEVGADVREIEKVGVMYPTPGYINEVIHLFYTEDFDLSNNYNLDEDEFLDVLKIDINKAYEMVDNGEIKDAKTLILLYKCKDRLLNKR